MPPSTTLAPVLNWLREHTGPVLTALLIAGSMGWYLRDRDQAPIELRAGLARLDSTTVKRDTFALFVRDINGQLRELRSTSDLLRRFVCRRSPDLCP